MSHDAIPTVYRGVQFRSRLEARWACMFDHLGWTWHYEPIDLEGYIPDFIVRAKGGNVLVEVKPFLDVEEPVVWDACAKIVHTSWAGKDAVVVGAAVTRDGDGGVGGGGDRACVGAFTTQWGELAPDGPYERTDPDPSAAIARCSGCHLWTFARTLGIWRCTHCGEGKGSRGYNDFDKVHALWLTAGNAVQWRSPARC